MNALKNFIEKNGMYSFRYDEAYKKQFARAGQGFCNELVKLLGLDNYRYYYNKAGIACSGDVSFFGEKNGRMFYLHFNTDGTCGTTCDTTGYYRTVKGFTDYTGGKNIWFNMLDTTEQIAKRIREIL
jgi:hypothetical protein